MAHYATDAAELAEFLDMAGLTPEEGRVEPTGDPPEEPIDSSAAPEPAVPPDEIRRLASALLSSYTDAVRNP